MESISSQKCYVALEINYLDFLDILIFDIGKNAFEMHFKANSHINWETRNLSTSGLFSCSFFSC